MGPSLRGDGEVSCRQEPCSLPEERHEAMSIENDFGPEYTTIHEYDPTPDVLTVRQLNRPELHNDFVRLVAVRDAGLRPARLVGATVYLGDAVETNVSAGVYDYQDSIILTRDDHDGSTYFEEDIPLSTFPDFMFSSTEDGLGRNPIGLGDVHAITIRRRTRIDLSKGEGRDALSIYMITNPGGLARTDALAFTVATGLDMQSVPIQGYGVAYTEWHDSGPVRRVRTPDGVQTYADIDRDVAAILKHITSLVDRID